MSRRSKIPIFGKTWSYKNLLEHSVRVKRGVAFEDISPDLLPLIEAIAKTQDVITSVTDGKHGTNSLHYDGLAVDLRFRKDVDEQYDFYNRVLPPDFNIIKEKDHFHISFDSLGERA